MSDERRKFMERMGAVSLLLAAGLLRPGRAWAQQGTWNKQAFETKSLADAVKAMGGGAPIESKDITLTSPDIAENGAVVPFTISSKIPNTQAIALLIEKNPAILAANFSIPQGTEPWVNTRAKMAQTSNVYAVVKGGDGKFYYAAKEVKVTLGGCGG